MAEMRSYQGIGAASGWGAQLRGCEEGPEVFLKKGGMEKLRVQGVPLVDWITLHSSVSARDRNISLSESLSVIVELNKRLSEAVIHAKQRDLFPVILGGDHSIAVGTWNGVAQSLNAPLGLLWIDAHMDAHTPETSPSGAWHGMPLAALMGYGEPQLSHLLKTDPVILPEHVCLIGVRSFEQGEADLLKRLNVRIYDINEVQKRGFGVVLKEAIAYVNQGTGGFGVSVDLDVLDPKEAPGVGSPELNGLKANELISALSQLAHDPRLKGFELVEFNPERDQNDLTFHMCCHILKAVLLQG